jgi:hypothetical protein
VALTPQAAAEARAQDLQARLDLTNTELGRLRESLRVRLSEQVRRLLDFRVCHTWMRWRPSYATLLDGFA